MHINKRNRNIKFVFKSFGLICRLNKYKTMPNILYFLIDWCDDIYLLIFIVEIRKLDKFLHTCIKQNTHNVCT